MKDHHHRSIAKAVSWRIFASITTMLIVFFFTGELILSVGIGATEVLSKMAIYYGHERAWNKINWGKL